MDAFKLLANCWIVSGLASMICEVVPSSAQSGANELPPLPQDIPPAYSTPCPPELRCFLVAVVCLFPSSLSAWEEEHYLCEPWSCQKFPPTSESFLRELHGSGLCCTVAGGPAAFLAKLVLASLPSLGVCPADSSSFGLPGLTARLSA